MSPVNAHVHRRQWILGALAIVVACLFGLAGWYVSTGSNARTRTGFIAGPTTSPTRQDSSGVGSAAFQAFNAKPTGGTHTGTPSPSCGTWEQQPGPGTGTLWAELKAVAAASPDDAWAVGVQGDNPTSNWGPLEAPDGAHILIAHWDGKHWVVVPGPDMGGDYGSLQAVAAISRGDVWAAGIRVASGPGSGANVQALILHWDGQKWSLVAGPGSGPAAYKIGAIAASASDDVWAIGSYPTNLTGAIPMLHWDGQRWNNVPGPPNAPYNLRSLVAISKNQAWAVGSRPRPGTMFYSLPVINHWDGAHWSSSPTNLSGNLLGVSALSQENVWAVGWAGNQRPPGAVPPVTSGAVIAHKGKDESSWAQMDSPYPGRPPGTQASPEEFTIDTLSSVAAIAPNDVWAVGTRDYSPAFGALGSTQMALIEHWDGSAWSVIVGPQPGKGGSQLTSIVATGNGKELWAAGTWYAEAGKPAQPLILHYKPAPCPAPQDRK